MLCIPNLFLFYVTLSRYYKAQEVKLKEINVHERKVLMLKQEHEIILAKMAEQGCAVVGKEVGLFGKELLGSEGWTPAGSETADDRL